MTDGDSGPRILSVEILAQGWATFKRVTFEVPTRDGGRRTLVREIQDHGNGVAVLPVDRGRGMVLLVRQFRLAALLAGHDGMMLEACAGLVEAGESPADAVRREAREELGYRLGDLTAAFDLFSSPGSLTERMALFTATYTPDDRIAAGGGAGEEGEDIEVVEMGLDEAAAQCAGGGIVDAKTVILVQRMRAINVGAS